MNIILTVEKKLGAEWMPAVIDGVLGMAKGESRATRVKGELSFIRHGRYS